MDASVLIYEAVKSFRQHIQPPQSESDKMFLDYSKKCFNYLQNGGEITVSWLTTNAFILLEAINFYHKKIDAEINEARLCNNSKELMELRNARTDLLRIKSFIKQEAGDALFRQG